MRLMQHALDLPRVSEAGEDAGARLRVTALYNADDCYSTWSLRMAGSGPRGALVVSVKEVTDSTLGADLCKWGFKLIKKLTLS